MGQGVTRATCNRVITELPATWNGASSRDATVEPRTEALAEMYASRIVTMNLVALLA